MKTREQLKKDTLASIEAAVGVDKWEFAIKAIDMLADDIERLTRSELAEKAFSLANEINNFRSRSERSAVTDGGERS